MAGNPPRTPKNNPPQPIQVFGMGVLGVNLVKSPLELEEGELTNAQNAEPFRVQGLTGIRKRPGLQKVNPTGPILPGDLGGEVVGLSPVNDNDVLTTEAIWFYGPYYSPDALNWSPWDLVGILPNTIYDLKIGGTYDPNLTPLLPAVCIDSVFYFGGHESGQLVGWDHNADPTRGEPFFGDARMREVARLEGTGSPDDVYPLPGVFSKFGVSALVVSIAGGGVQLYYPDTGNVKKLPTLPATATGSASFGARLWVVAGLSLYSIDPDNEASWTLAATVADAGIAALTGLASHGGFLYAGSRTNAIQPVRCYKFAVNSDVWTATATTDASVNQLSSPSYMYGPYPQLTGTRVNVLYFGSAGLFDTLQGSLGNAESMNGISWRILTLDRGTAGPWHNGQDTNSDNLIAAWWSGSSTRLPGPIVNVGGRFAAVYTHFQDSGDYLSLAICDPLFTGGKWSAGSGVKGQNMALVAATFFRYPLTVA